MEVQSGWRLHHKQVVACTGTFTLASLCLRGILLDHLVQILIISLNTLLAEFVCFSDMRMYSHQHDVPKAWYGLSYMQ